MPSFDRLRKDLRDRYLFRRARKELGLRSLLSGSNFPSHLFLTRSTARMKREWERGEKRRRLSQLQNKRTTRSPEIRKSLWRSLLLSRTRKTDRGRQGKLDPALLEEATTGNNATQRSLYMCECVAAWLVRAIWLDIINACSHVVLDKVVVHVRVRTYGELCYGEHAWA